MDGSTGLGSQPDWRPGDDLTRLEETMVAGAASGELVDCGEGPFSLAEMQAWEADRTLRAAVLRHLLITGEWPVDAKGVRLRGARIGGLLDLEAAAVRCPLALEECYLDADEPARLDHASASRVTLAKCHLAGLSGQMLTARQLDLRGSTLTHRLYLPNADIAGNLACDGAQLTGADSDGNALFADGLKTGGNVFLRDAFTAAGAVRLPGADIAGQFDCSVAQLTGVDSDGDALVADGLKTGGAVLLRDCTAAGTVRLPGADIAVNLECDGAQLTTANRGGNALVADGLKTRGAVFLRDGFTAAGAVRLLGADITSGLDCTGAQLTGVDSDGNALFADGLKTGGDVFLRDCTAAGAVRLPGADIAGQFDCTGAQLTGVDSDGDALFADGLKTGGAVFLRGGFTAAGTVSLSSARVGASVYLTPTALAIDGKVALNAAGAQIVGTLRWAPASAVSGQVNLEGATAGRLDDDWSSGRPNGYWPTGGRLRLDGFTYDRFGGAQRATANQRWAWIRSQYQANAADSQAEFATQPYEQLTAVYQQAGQDTEARKVAIARRADLRKYGDLNSYRRVGNWFLGWSIGYGYKTWRAGLVLVGVFAAVVVLSFFAQQHHLMVPVGDTDGLRFVPSATRCTSSYPCFSPVGYAVDTVIPVVNVHQADNWGPDAHTTLGHAWAAGTRFATVLGWALATLLVAGFTGIVRRD